MPALSCHTHQITSYTPGFTSSSCIWTWYSPGVNKPDHVHSAVQALKPVTIEWNRKDLSHSNIPNIKQTLKFCIWAASHPSRMLFAAYFLLKTTEGPIQALKSCSSLPDQHQLLQGKGFGSVAPAHTFAISEVKHTTGRRNSRWKHHHFPVTGNAHVLTAAIPASHTWMCLPAAITTTTDSKKTPEGGRKEIAVCCNTHPQ